MDGVPALDGLFLVKIKRFLSFLWLRLLKFSVFLKEVAADLIPSAASKRIWCIFYASFQEICGIWCASHHPNLTIIGVKPYLVCF